MKNSKKNLLKKIQLTGLLIPNQRQMLNEKISFENILCKQQLEGNMEKTK